MNGHYLIIIHYPQLKLQIYTTEVNQFNTQVGILSMLLQTKVMPEEQAFKHLIILVEVEVEQVLKQPL